ncbi:MAG: GYD domain-containing protein [Chloroflexota bacterium]|nr:GYD domain-containing protein [Chloroflexota bacterium]
MAHYLLQFAYTPQAWGALAKHPENRFDAVRELVDKLGGRTIAAYYCFGEYDGVILAELPDDAHAAAFSVAANAAGHNRAFKTTVLLPVEEAMVAMRLAAGLEYRPPMTPEEHAAAAVEDQTRATATAHQARHTEGDAVTTESMDSMDASDPPSWARKRS